MLKRLTWLPIIFFTWSALAVNGNSCQDLFAQPLEHRSAIPWELKNHSQHSQKAWLSILAQLGANLVWGAADNRSNAFSPSASNLSANQLIQTGFYSSIEDLKRLRSDLDSSINPADLNARLMERSFALIRYFSGRKAELHAQGLREDEILQPGFVFLNKEGTHWEILEFGEEVSSDLEPVLDTTSGFFDDDMYNQSIELGFVILQLSGNPQTFFAFHDVSHLLGLFREPAYMTFVRKLYQTLANEVERNGNKVPAGSRHSYLAFFIFEMFGHIQKSSLLAFLQKYDLEKALECSSMTCLQNLVEDFLKANPGSLLHIKSEALSSFDLYGGSVLGRQSTRQQGISDENFDPFQSLHNGSKLIQVQLARFLNFAIRSSKMTVREHLELIERGPSRQLCEMYSVFFDTAPRNVQRTFCPWAMTLSHKVN